MKRIRRAIRPGSPAARAILAGLVGAALTGGAWADPCPATLSLSDGLTGAPGQTVSIPVAVSDVTGLGVISADLTLQHDASVLNPVAVTAGTLTGSCTLVPHTGVTGQVTVAIYCLDELAGTGSLAIVEYQVAGTYLDQSPLGLTFAQLNEGTPAVCLDPGSFRVCGAELCDGVDNDCDAAVDEGFGVGAGCSAGLGECAATGVTVCAGSGLETVCDAVPGPPTGDDTDCDGLDQDCDGVSDDGYVARPIVCAPPACGQPGVRTCEGGLEMASCDPGVSVAIPDSVAGIPGQPVDVPVLASDLTGLGALSSDIVIEYSPAVLQATAVLPGSLTSGPGCMATPNLTLPGRITLSVFCPQHLAGAGSLAILTFSVQPAGGTTPLHLASVQINEGDPGVCSDDGSLDACRAELCDGLDNDCDGAGDNGFDLGQACSEGMGECAAAGVTVCSGDGLRAECNATPGTPTGPDDDCDGLDQDCDGTRDDGFVPYPVPCGPAPCERTGVAACVQGSVQDSCVPLDATIHMPVGVTQIPGETLVVPVLTTDLTGLSVLSADITIGFDPSTLQATGASPGSLTAACEVVPNMGVPGQLRLAIYCVDPLAGSGSLAEAAFAVTGPYGSVSGLTLAAATLNEGDPTACTDDGSFAACGPELCDGLDNDCDGAGDDGSPGSGEACSTGLPGVCAAGTTLCSGGSLLCEQTEQPSADAQCNGLDDDCDGLPDDEYAPVPTSCGAGSCAGNTGERLCVEGVEQDTCDPLAGAVPDTTCNELDDDCDGVVDNGFDTGAPCVASPGSCPPPARIACGPDGLSTVCRNDPTLTVELPPPSLDALVTWAGIPGASLYDLVRGSLQPLHASTGNFTLSTQGCLANDVPSGGILDQDPLIPGEGFWYLMRAVGCTGAGTYDSGAPEQSGSRDGEILISGSDCP